MADRVKYIVLILFVCASISVDAQSDSLAQVFLAKKNIEELQNEQKELNFQKFFFQALQQKAIGNFDKAINALETCQNIKNNDKAVEFEFAKNYFELDKYLDYVEKQETQLGEIEQQKSLLSNTFFKDNKENPSITLNAEI